MNYPVKVEGFEGQNVEVRAAGLLSGAKLFVNGQEAPKASSRGGMTLRRNDGREVVATWKPNFVDIPNLSIDGKAIQVVPALQWYEWIWNGLPLGLIGFGGMLGGILGAIAFGLNTRIFRSSQNALLKFGLTGAVSVAAFVVFFVVAIIMGSWLNTTR